MIWWTEVHEINTPSFGMIKSNASRDATSPAYIKKYISATHKESHGFFAYIRGERLSALRHPLGLVCPPYPLPWAHYTSGPHKNRPIPLRHVGSHMGSHGSVSTQVVPPRVRVTPRQLCAGPALNKPLFAFFF